MTPPSSSETVRSQEPNPTACEFCEELAATNGSRFHRLYPGVTDRIVLENAEAVAMPSLGQFFFGTILVIPRSHFVTLASCPRNVRDDVLGLAMELAELLEAYGTPTLFEHGSFPRDANPSGIYHAHLHVVPLPRPVRLDEALPAGVTCTNVEMALEAIARERRYLLFGTPDGEASFRLLAHDDSATQYFRRRLYKVLGIARDPDWRQRGSELEVPHLIRGLRGVPVG